MGTRFTVERDEGQVEVSVERGVVRVTGALVPAGRRSLRGGESLVIAGPAPAPASPAVASAADAAPTWRQLAQGGDDDGAFALLGADGIGREARGARSVDDLFLLADVARRSGHPAEAVAPLERAIAAHATDPRAAVAAITLGRLHLE